MLLLPKQPQCISYLWLDRAATASSINTFGCHGLASTAEDAWNTEAGESGRFSPVRGVCAFCVNSYCKWDLKNWHSHLSSTLCISHKQMKAQSLKVRLISLSELRRGYSEYGERFVSPWGTHGAPIFQPEKVGYVHLFCQLIFILCRGSWNVDKHNTIDGPEIPLYEIEAGIKIEQPPIFSGLEAEQYISLRDWKLFNLCDGSSPEPSH